MNGGSLRVIFDPGFGGKTLTMVLPVDEHIAQAVTRCPPPDPALSMIGLPGNSMSDVVELIHAREFRKRLFIRECTRLGALLAERMEDAEGWHDISRIDSAKRELSQ